MNKKSTILLFAALLVTHPVVAAEKKTVVPTDRDRAELKKIMRSHTFRGKGVSRGVRAAAGDPNMAVIDRRRPGSSSQCSFITLRGKRAMQCQS
jgi:hypothetical protein